MPELVPPKISVAGSILVEKFAKIGPPCKMQVCNNPAVASWLSVWLLIQLQMIELRHLIYN